MSEPAEKLATIHLANDALECVVAPPLGGKILSLRSSATGREWLWTNPHLPHRWPPEPSEDGCLDFGKYDFGGWDEILPSVSPCFVAAAPWNGRRINDHGELWYRPWRIETNKDWQDLTRSVTLAVDGAELPFRFKRTLTLPPGDAPLVVEYSLENCTPSPLPYVWAAHPLFTVSPGISIFLPPGTRTTAAACFGFELSDARGEFEWPRAGLTHGCVLDFSRFPSDTGWAAKLFTERLDDAWVEFHVDSSREKLRLRWDAAVTPYLALWLNFGAWSGARTAPYFNCGIEPTTSAFDSLTNALEAGQAAVLAPYSNRTWNLSLRVSNS